MKAIDFININRPSYKDDMNGNSISQKNKLESKKMESSLYQYPKDIIDINYANNKELISTNGDKVNFKYNKNGIIVTVDKKDIEHQIKSENLPSELKQIHNPEQLNKFLDKAYVNVKTLSDGDIKLDVKTKLKGGMWSSSSSSPMRAMHEHILGITIERGSCLEHNLGFGIPHSSIYVGKDKVIGVTNDKSGDYLGMVGSVGTVEKHSMYADAVMGKYDDDDVMFTLEKVAQRAESKLGKTTTYNLDTHNCHNFTNWCRTGKDYNSIAGEYKKADKWK